MKRFSPNLSKIKPMKGEISKAYLISYIAFSAVIFIPSAFLIYVGIVTSSSQHLIFWGGLTLVNFCFLTGLIKRFRIAFWLTLTLSTLLWLMLAVRTGHRIKFIIKNDGMERADGYGSPMAFLIGIVEEQLFFMPLCFVVIIGWLSVASRGKRKKDLVSDL